MPILVLALSLVLWSGATPAEVWRPAIEAEVTALVDSLPRDEAARVEALRVAGHRYFLASRRDERGENEYAAVYLQKLILERFSDSPLAESTLGHLAWRAEILRGSANHNPGHYRLQRSLFYPAIATLIRQPTDSPQRRHALAFLTHREYGLLGNQPVVEELIRRSRSAEPLLAHASRELLARYVEIHAPPGAVPPDIYLESQGADAYLKHFGAFFSEVESLLASDSAPHREIGLFGARLALGNPALFGNFEARHETNAVREGQAKVLRTLVRALKSPDFPRVGDALAILRNLPASLVREVPLSWIRAVVRHHPNADVALILLERSSSLPRERWGEVILAALHHRSSEVRAAALGSLRKHVTSLRSTGHWPPVHVQIAERIRQLRRVHPGEPELFTPQVEKFLSDQAIRDGILAQEQDRYLRANPLPEGRARYLARFTEGAFDWRARELVLRFLTQDSNESVRKAAAEVLLRRAAEDPSLLQELLHRLSGADRDPSEALRGWIAEELYERYPTPEVRTAISRAYVQGGLPELPGPGLRCYRNFAEAHALFSL